MKRIAIISFYHTESSLCLAKYLAEQGVEVDYFAIAVYIHDCGWQSGFEYPRASRRLGLHRLTAQEVPELYEYSKGLPVQYHLIRLFWHSEIARCINHFIWQRVFSYIRKQHYEAIDIVGQKPWIKIIHDGLSGENLVHTLHEVGSHQDGIATNSLMETLIKDKTPLVFHSQSTADRFLNIPGSECNRIAVIPFGKFETSLLYERAVEINHGMDLTKPTFLFYGIIKPYKGLDILAKSMKLLSKDHDKFNLIVAGDGMDSNIPYFESLNNCYVLNRFLSNEEMMELNKICSAVVLPYHTASQTGIIPTCFLYGKPVIATSVGAFVESVRNGYNGLLVEKDNPQAFAEAMKRCYEGPSLLTTLSHGAKNYGNGDAFDWRIIAQQTLRFIFES